MALSSSEADSSSPPSKVALVKWWKRFNKKGNESTGSQHSDSNATAAQAGSSPPTRVFGLSLQDSLRYASVAISQVGPDGKARIYGHIPVIVAKTGLFLKENGTTTQGVFRVSGSNKRIKELEQIFDTPPSYGKNMTWDTFSVHDAASVFRRYLNMLPEPIIPFVLYQSFQDVLPKQKNESERDAAILAYRSLINSLPPASQHIFFYVLDLLGVFARRSDQNLMPASNLATIFQPGLIRHQPRAPNTQEDDKDVVIQQIEADANEHKKSQEVLEFLIENQNSFELELPSTTSMAARKAARRKSPTATLGSLVSGFSSPSRPLSPTVKSKQSSAPSNRSKPGSSTSPSAIDESEDENWHDARTHPTDLVRRGSDRSEHRKHLRRKKAAEAKRIEGNVNGVRRSRTLPSSKEGRPASSSRPHTSNSTNHDESADQIKPLKPAPTAPPKLLVPTTQPASNNRRLSMQSDEQALSSATASPISHHESDPSDSGFSDPSVIPRSPASPPPEKRGWWRSKRPSIDARLPMTDGGLLRKSTSKP